MDELRQLWPDEDRRTDALARVAERMRAQDERPLTRSELLALGAASHGLGWREAADALGWTPETVRSVLQDARRKLAAKNTAHAVALAMRQRLLS